MSERFISLAEEMLEEGADVVDLPATGENEHPLKRAMREARTRIDARKVRVAEEIPLGGYNAADLCESEMPDVEWTIDGILPKESVGVIGAEYKGCKSWMCCELAIALATGGNLLGDPKWRVEKRGHVLYVALEDGVRNMRSRLRAMALGRRLDFREALGRIFVIPRPPALDINSPRGQDWLVAQAQSMPEEPKAIVLDPFGNIHRAKSENDSAEILPVMNALKVVRDALSTSVLVSHHMGKAKEEGKQKRRGRLADRLRGSSAMFQAVDAWLLMDHRGEEQTTRSRRWDVVLEAGSREGGGGVRSIELDVQLKDNGTANTAAWTIKDQKPKTADEENADTVRRHMLDGGWFSKDSLARALDVSKSTIDRALKTLKAADEIESKGNGPTTEWRYIGDD